ncbi:ribonuclease HII [Actinomycetes bacterium]|nr:ribonuclease HII [Actinomycetes bacterium]
MIEAKLISTGFKYIAGVDEAGRGACAGPLVIAAVILDSPLSEKFAEVRDSKELTEKQRERLYTLIIDNSISYAIISATVSEIDSGGVHRVNIEGMRRAVLGLKFRPEYVLTDGYKIEGLAIPALAVWKGDQVAVSISAASILAKVTRDQIMRELDSEYPNYGMSSHKGYITKKHSAALAKFGVTEIHRKSFANIADLIHNG